MQNFSKRIYIGMIVIYLLSNVMTTAAYAAPLVKVRIHLPIPKRNDVLPQGNIIGTTAILHADKGSVLGASTSIMNVGSQELDVRQNTIQSASQRIPIIMQALDKKVYSTDEDVTFAVTNPDNESFTTSVTDTDGKDANVTIDESTNGSSTTVDLAPSNAIKPGLYKVKVTDAENKTTEQDFAWGVLALNTDKSMYHANEKGDIAIAVLNDKGDMVCDATVDLQITKPDGTIDELSTSNSKIAINPQCQKHDYSLQPDYEAKYQFQDVGVYNFQLQADNGSGMHTISASIPVKGDIPFDVQRLSATRIYPPNTYPMIFNVTANRDFSGTVTETVPESFTITPASDSASQSYSSMQTFYLNAADDPTAQMQQTLLGTGQSTLVMPFHGDYPITQGFGAQLTDPTLQAFYTHYGLGGHDGIDFGLPMNTPLYTVDGGTVIWSGPGDYGTMVTIQHSWGKTYYGHMTNTSVTVGQQVTKGQLIGYSGMTGEATGPHLHFGMKPNTPDMANGYYGKIDPMPYLPLGHEAESITMIPGNTLLSSVLGASDSAGGASPTPTALPTATPAPSSVPSGSPTPSVSDTAVSDTPTPSPTTSAGSLRSIVPANTNSNFTVLDKEIQLNEEIANNAQTEKVKVITWKVNLKKGESTSLGYDYQTPKVSPEFYLLGPVKFYDNNTAKTVFEEERAWQIAADSVGNGWFTDTTGRYSQNGYSWPYRKKLTIDHTKTSSAQFLQNHPTPSFMEPGGDATGDMSMYSSNCGNGGESVDSTTSETGPDSLKFNSQVGDTSACLNTPTATIGKAGRISMYIKLNQLTGGDFIEPLNSAGTSLGQLLGYNSTTHRFDLNASGDGQGPTNIQTGVWYRVAVVWKVNTTTTGTLKLFVNGHLELNESTFTAFTSTSFDHLRIGNLTPTVASSSVNIDDVYIDRSLDPYDPGDMHVTNKKPIADGAANGYTTQGAAAGTACSVGSGTHCQYVNEQPVNNIDFLKVTANGSQESFTIQSASAGDVDISKSLLVSDQSWMIASSSARCTGQIYHNGTISPVSIYTSFVAPGQTTYAVSTSSATLTTTYPSGNQAMGIQSCGAGATTAIMEGGVLIAYIPSDSAVYMPTTITQEFMDAGGDATNTNGGTNFTTAQGGFYGSTSITVPATLTTDCTVSHTGSCSYKASNSTVNKAYLQTPNLSTTNAGRASMWVYVDSMSGVTSLPFAILSTSVGGLVERLQVDPSGKFELSNGAAVQSETTTTVQAGTWYRISVAWNITSTSVNEFKMWVNGQDQATIYNDTTVPAANVTFLRIGNNDNTDSATTVHEDDIYIDNSNSMDDPGDIRVTNKHPLSNGALNQFTASGTPTGPASGSSGNAQYVDEEPLNVNANVAVSTANKRENYTLESASQGDEDISSAGIVGSYSWVYAKSSAACTGLMTYNGVDDVISLSTSDTMIASASANANFLSGTQGIGIQSCNSTQTVTLEEAGVMIAYTPNNPDNTLTNFPVLVSIFNDNDVKKAQASCIDLDFTDSTGSTKLNYEFDTWAGSTLSCSTNGSFQAWVQVPVLHTDQDTIIYMYFGNPAVTTSQQNASGTWDGGFQSVYHLEDNDGAATKDDIADSTSFGHTASLDNGYHTSTDSKFAQIQNGMWLEKAGASDVIEAAGNGALGVQTHQNQDLTSATATGSATFSFWFNCWFSTINNSGTASGNCNAGTSGVQIAGVDSSSASGNDMVINWNRGSGTPCGTTTGQMCFQVDNGNSVTAIPSVETSWTRSVWYYVTAVVDANQKGAQLYVNGAQDGASQGYNRGAPDSGENFIWFGSEKVNQQYASAAMDEIRISDTPRSPGWIYTDYQTQASGSAMLLNNSSIETSIYAPTMDQLMRHGEWFDPTGTIQPFSF